jgi:uncharacterized protein HemX
MDDTLPVPESADEPTEPTHTPPTPGVEAQPPAGMNQTLRAVGITAIALVVVLLGVGQVFLIVSQKSANEQIQSLDHQIDDLNTSVGDMSEQVDDIAVSATTAETGNATGAATPAPAVPAGFLPRYSDQGPDQAIGMELSFV